MNQLNLSLPDWINSFLNEYPKIIPDPEKQMRFVLALTERNIREETGGPFGSAVFERDSGKLVSVGVNVVVRQNCSAAHAEMMALMLIIVFAVILGVLPAGGLGPHGVGGIWDNARYLVLPVVALTIASIGGHTRYMRAAMIETLRQDYIRTARATGASEARVVFGHALRNALIPVVTIIALDFGALFSGALITETIFAWPGMGRLIYDAIMGNDFNLALVALLLATVLTLIGNFLADVAYVWLDPRVSFREVDR